MINAQMRQYEYYTYGEQNAYGQQQLSAEPQGVIKMAINITSQNTQDNILYNNSTYIGLTTDAEVNDTYVIKYEKERLKVMYVNPMGRFKQVFMARM
jgi:hypothetical protein